MDLSGVSGGFAFDTTDKLEAITETSREYSKSSDRLSEHDVEEAKREAARAAKSAEKEWLEMGELLKKLKTGTATRVERDRFAEVKGKLSALKKEAEETKYKASTAERALLEDSTRMKEREVLVALKKKEVRAVIRSVCAAERVDLAFIVDCTGSMGSHIASVKENVKKIVRQIMKTNGNLKIRLAFVCYRDFCDGANHFEILNFVDSVGKFEDFVSRLKAKGGGDSAEDMAGGVKQANALSWDHPTRVCFVIADAPCHGREFHSLDDDYPSGSPGINILVELEKLKTNCGEGSMSLYFGRIGAATDSMITTFKRKGISLEVVELDDVAALTDVVSKSVRDSIFKTVTATGGATRSISALVRSGKLIDSIDLTHGKSRTKPRISLKTYRIVATKPSSTSWKRYAPMKVQVYRNKKVKHMSELQLPLGVGKVKKSECRTDVVDTSTMFMKKSADPFAEGQIRLAFHGHLARSEKDLKLPGSEMILKAFKHRGDGVNDLDRYLKQMEVSSIVQFLADCYSKSSARPPRGAKVRCLACCVIEELSEEHEESGNRRFCAEAPLPIPVGGEFVKYSNNTGYWNEAILDESLLRFSLYTHEVTEGYLMVTDLQGIKAEDGSYYLTDPVILCEDILRFGETNLGPGFIKKCFQSTRAMMELKGWK